MNIPDKAAEEQSDLTLNDIAVELAATSLVESSIEQFGTMLQRIMENCMYDFAPEGDSILIGPDQFDAAVHETLSDLSDK